MPTPRWEDEDITFGAPDPDKIVCKDCMFREADHKFFPGSTYAFCEMYYKKPTSILWQGGDCPYYRNEYNPHRDDDDDE